MNIKISERAMNIKPTPTLTISSLAKEMLSNGINVVNFGVGEPDFNTPDYIKEEAKKAIDDNFTKYTKSAGINELRAAISLKLKRDNNLTCNPNDILVSPGAKASIVFILMAICDPGDEVLIPIPYWVSYPSQVVIAGAEPVIVPTKRENDFKITTAQLEKKITSRSKVLILNSPNNPTGTVYSKNELEKIGEFCLKHNILIISDEIYEKLIYDNEKHISIASVSEEILEITVLINGVSKAYAMTGWRLGYSAGPTEVIRRASIIQSHTTSCVNSMTQKATVVALSEGDGNVEKMRKEFEQRRNFLIETLNNLENIECMKPKGAFYAFPDVSYYLKNNKNGIKNSAELCEFLLKYFHVALVPGSAFGNDDYVRFSYANGMDSIKTGLERFEEGLKACLK
ncbi:MAG TPA: pyridoxal phosphate-dependent aminotransferase [Candidatus Cloacimonetes bacterium]|nr:pyridoxal phosphate-dependent aminotransferase [Candidatus Cloacimonadota bacterium]